MLQRKPAISTPSLPSTPVTRSSWTRKNTATSAALFPRHSDPALGATTRSRSPNSTQHTTDLVAASSPKIKVISLPMRLHLAGHLRMARV